MTNAKPSINLEPVSHATLATISSTEPVNLHPSRNLLMRDVEPGTGRTINVWPAPTTGSSIKWANAYLSLINAIPSTELELANHATRATTSSKEDVSWLPLKKYQILDAVNGTGKRRSVLPALTDSFSMQLDFASPSMITATNGTTVEPVLSVTLDTCSTKENVSWEILFVKNLTQMEPVCLVTLDTSVTMEVVYLFPNWPHLPCTTPSAALKSWLNLPRIWEDLQEVMLNSTHDVFADLYLNKLSYLSSYLYIILCSGRILCLFCQNPICCRIQRFSTSKIGLSCCIFHPSRYILAVILCTGPTLCLSLICKLLCSRSCPPSGRVRHRPEAFQRQLCDHSSCRLLRCLRGVVEISTFFTDGRENLRKWVLELW